MRKRIAAATAVAVGLTLFLGAMTPDKRYLKGLKYARIQCEFTGVPFYKGYKSPKEENMEEFNLEEAVSGLKQAGIPIGKDNIRALYDQLESMLKKTGLRIVTVKNSSDMDDSSILPTISIGVEVITAPKSLYFVRVDLTVSQWMSTWVGTENLHAPVITWWQEKMLAAEPKELNKLIETAARELCDEFTLQWLSVNPKEEPQQNTGKTSNQGV